MRSRQQGPPRHGKESGLGSEGVAPVEVRITPEPSKSWRKTRRNQEVHQGFSDLLQ